MRGNLKSQAVDLQKAFTSGSDMSSREAEVLEDIITKTGFSPKEVIWRSSYWGTGQIGAVHYLGEFESRPAVLKIQGVKPEISEIVMIEQFATQNRSKTIRPPKILSTLSWSDSAGYEALIMEHVTGKKVLESKQLQTIENIATFLKYYLEYRQNCLPKKPWLPKPEQPNWGETVDKLIAISQKAYPDHPFRQVEDFELVRKAGQLLAGIYLRVPLEFVCGHFSVEDLIYQENQVVLFSNLFWKWKYPFYDAVFGYHWFMYELGNVEEITSDQVEQQRELWLSQLLDLPWVRESLQNLRLAKAALLERATAGLIIDSFLVDKNRPIAKYLVDSTRGQVKKLVSELTR